MIRSARGLASAPATAAPAHSRLAVDLSARARAIDSWYRAGREIADTGDTMALAQYYRAGAPAPYRRPDWEGVYRRAREAPAGSATAGDWPHYVAAYTVTRCGGALTTLPGSVYCRGRGASIAYYLPESQGGPVEAIHLPESHVATASGLPATQIAWAGQGGERGVLGAAGPFSIASDAASRAAIRLLDLLAPAPGADEKILTRA